MPVVEAILKRSQGRIYRGYARVFVRASGDVSDYPHELGFLSSVVINEEPTEYEDSFGQPHVIEVRSECLLRFHQFGGQERSFFYDEAVCKPMDYRVLFYATALENRAMLVREYENQYVSSKAVQDNNPYYEVRLSGLFTPLEAGSLFEEFRTPEQPDFLHPLYNEVLPHSLSYLTMQVATDEDTQLTVRVYEWDSGTLIEEFVDVPSSSGVPIAGGRRRLDLTMTQALANGFRYRAVAFSRRLGRKSLEREWAFVSGFAVPTLTYSSPHFYINNLSITLSLVTNATQYQLRWRRVGSVAWNEFLPQSASNRTFVILSSVLDDALIVLNDIEVQGRAFNDVVSSAWSAAETIQINEPSFSVASVALESSQYQSGKHERLETYSFQINLTRAVAGDVSPITATPTSIPALSVSFSQNPISGSVLSGTVYVSALASLGAIPQAITLTSKHNTITQTATLNLDVIEKLSLIRIAADVKVYNTPQTSDLYAFSSGTLLSQIKNLGALGGSFEQSVATKQWRLRAPAATVPLTSVPVDTFINEQTPLSLSSSCQQTLSISPSLPPDIYTFIWGFRYAEITDFAFLARLLFVLSGSFGSQSLGVSDAWNGSPPPGRRVNFMGAPSYFRVFEHRDATLDEAPPTDNYSTQNPSPRSVRSSRQTSAQSLGNLTNFSIVIVAMTVVHQVNAITLGDNQTQPRQRVLFFEMWRGDLTNSAEKRGYLKSHLEGILDRIGLSSWKTALVL